MGNPLTATRALQEQTYRRIAATAHRMFDRLKEFVRAYPVNMDDVMPEHDIVWTTSVCGSPESVILDAIRSNPAIWRSALPDTVVIMPRKMLEQVGLSSDTIEVLAGYGASMVETAAAKYEYDLDQRERAQHPSVSIE